MSVSIVLSREVFAGLSANAQQEILSFLRSDSTNIESRSASDQPEELADLSPQQIRKALQRASQKTNGFLREIARRERKILWNDLLSSCAEGGDDDLSGVRRGFTRAARNVIGDPDIDIIGWQAVYDEDGEHVDDYLVLSEMTHSSLRKHFGFGN